MGGFNNLGGRVGFVEWTISITAGCAGTEGMIWLIANWNGPYHSLGRPMPKREGMIWSVPPGMMIWWGADQGLKGLLGMN